MARLFKQSTWDLEVNTDEIEVTSSLPYPDESWRAIDANGHEHYCDHGYPTLELIVDESHWCLGNEGLYAHDPHEAIDESHYECLICRLTIEPKICPPDSFRRFVPGLTTCILSGYRSDGAWVRARIDQSTARGIVGADESVQDAYVENALDRAEGVDVIEVRFPLGE